MSKRCLTCHWKQERIEELEAQGRRLEADKVEMLDGLERMDSENAKLEAKVERLVAVCARYHVADEVIRIALEGKQDG